MPLEPVLAAAALVVPPGGRHRTTPMSMCELWFKRPRVHIDKERVLCKGQERRRRRVDESTAGSASSRARTHTMLSAAA